MLVGCGLVGQFIGCVWLIVLLVGWLVGWLAGCCLVGLVVSVVVWWPVGQFVDDDLDLLLYRFFAGMTCCAGAVSSRPHPTNLYRTDRTYRTYHTGIYHIQCSTWKYKLIT